MHWKPGKEIEEIEGLDWTGLDDLGIQDDAEVEVREFRGCVGEGAKAIVK